MEVKTDNTNEMTLLEHALIAARRERQASEEAFNQVQRVYIDAKKRMQDAQTRFEGLSNRRTDYLFDVRDALLPASLHTQPGLHLAEIVEAQLYRIGRHYLTVKLHLQSGHYLTLNYTIVDPDCSDEEMKAKWLKVVCLLKAADVTCSSAASVEALATSLVGRCVMLNYAPDSGEHEFTPIAQHGYFWHDPITESCPPATGQAAA